MHLAHWMHFLRDVFQMTAIALMAHLNSSSEVVIHPDTLFFRYSTNHQIDDHFEFSNGLWIIRIHVVLQEHWEIKIWGGSDRMNSVTTWVHGAGLISRLGNQWLSHSIVMLAVCPMLLEPFHISLHISTCSEHSPKLVQHMFQVLSRTWSARFPSTLRNLFSTCSKYSPEFVRQVFRVLSGTCSARVPSNLRNLFSTCSKYSPELVQHVFQVLSGTCSELVPSTLQNLFCTLM